MDPNELFHCHRFNCKLNIRECANRQERHRSASACKGCGQGAENRGTLKLGPPVLKARRGFPTY